MSAPLMTQGVAELWPRFKARLAGALDLFSLPAAATSETLLHGSLHIARRSRAWSVARRQKASAAKRALISAAGTLILRRTH